MLSSSCFTYPALVVVSPTPLLPPIPVIPKASFFFELLRQQLQQGQRLDHLVK